MRNMMKIHVFIQNQTLCTCISGTTTPKRFALYGGKKENDEKQPDCMRLSLKEEKGSGKSRPIGRILLRCRWHYDSHSSRRRITPALKLPTHTLRGPHQCVPIWNCTRWRLPRFTVTQYARLCGPVPRLIPCGFRRTAVNRHPVLWCPDLPPVSGMNPETGDCLVCFFMLHFTGNIRNGTAFVRISCSLPM